MIYDSISFNNCSHKQTITFRLICVCHFFFNIYYLQNDTAVQSVLSTIFEVLTVQSLLNATFEVLTVQSESISTLLIIMLDKEFTTRPNDMVFTSYHFFDFSFIVCRINCNDEIFIILHLADRTLETLNRNNARMNSGN